MRGPRRELLLADPESFRVRVDTYLSRLGRRTFQVSESNVRSTTDLPVVRVVPDQIKLSFEARTPDEPGATRR